MWIADPYRTGYRFGSMISNWAAATALAPLSSVVENHRPVAEMSRKRRNGLRHPIE
jgi:hypothetical protein